jgi:hypothetical protein
LLVLLLPRGPFRSSIWRQLLHFGHFFLLCSALLLGGCRPAGRAAPGVIGRLRLQLALLSNCTVGLKLRCCCCCCCPAG